MEKLIKEIEFANEEVAPIAYKLGYEEKIVDPSFVPDGSPFPMIDNPKSMVDHISESVDDVISELLATAAQDIMKAEKSAEIQNAAHAIKEGIKARIVTTQN